MAYGLLGTLRERGIDESEDGTGNGLAPTGACPLTGGQVRRISIAVTFF